MKTIEKIIPRNILIFLLMVFICEARAQNNAEADAYFRTAETLKKNSKADSAILLYEKAADAYKSSGSSEERINCLNQAGALLTRQDKYNEALALLGLALMENKHLKDTNNLYVASTFITLGVIHNAEEQFEKSIQYHEKALAIRLKKLGEEHTETASSYGNIGNVFFNMKEYNKALINHTKALGIRKKLYGDTGYELAQSYANIGNVHKAMNKQAEAIDNYQKALDIKKAKYGNNHKELVKLYSQLSESYSILKDHKNADLNKKMADEIKNTSSE